LSQRSVAGAYVGDGLRGGNPPVVQVVLRMAADFVAVLLNRIDQLRVRRGAGAGDKEGGLNATRAEECKQGKRHSWTGAVVVSQNQ